MATPTFDDATRVRYTGLAAVFDEHERLIGEYQHRFRSRYVPEVIEADGLSFRDRLLSHLLSVVPRARSLALSAVVETNFSLGPGLLCAVRTHFELAGELAYLTKNLKPGQLDTAIIRRVIMAMKPDVAKFLTDLELKALARPSAMSAAARDRPCS